MSAAFSLYQSRDSGLHRLNPLTKMTIALSGVATSLIVSGVWGNYLLFLLILVPLSAWGQINYSFLRAVFRVVWPFAISIFLIQGLFWTDGTPVIDLGPLSFKAEGLLFAVISVGRILLLVGSFTLMTMSTRPSRMSPLRGQMKAWKACLRVTLFFCMLLLRV